MCVTKTVMSQHTLGWFGAYPEKQQAFRDLAEAIDTAAVPIIATKQPITPYSNCKGLNLETWRQPTKFAIAAILNFDFEFYFYPFSVYLQTKHDSFSAYGTLWCRFLNNTLT